MTLDQLRVFVAVAEREHLSRGAAALNLSPSAATAAVQALEGRHGAKLFHRIGRRLELSDAGRAFLPEARAVLRAVQAASSFCRIWAARCGAASRSRPARRWRATGCRRCSCASRPRTRAWLLTLTEGNTAGVAAAVLAGEAEVGCVEGAVDEPALAVTPLADDHLVVVAAHDHPLVRSRSVSAAALGDCRWVMRERGSGTRAVLEAALRAGGLDPDALRVILTLPTNEAVCAAAAASSCVTAVSELVAGPFIQAGAAAPDRHPAAVAPLRPAAPQGAVPHQGRPRLRGPCSVPRE